MALLNPYMSGRQFQNPMTRQFMNQQNRQLMGSMNRPVNQQMRGQTNQMRQPPMNQSQQIGWLMNQQMNQMNQPQQMNQMNQPQQMSPMNQMNQPQQMNTQNNPQQPGRQQNQQMGHPQNQPNQPVNPGANYEQLTEAQIAEILNKNKSEPASQPDNQKHENLEIFFNVSEPLLEKIMETAQNGQNGWLFYEDLSRKASGENIKKQLVEIGEESQKLSKELSSIYHTLTGKDCGIKRAEIVSETDIYRGLRLAINEENKNLSDICDIYEGMVDERQNKKLNLLIYRKIRDINRLHMLLSRI